MDKGKKFTSHEWLYLAMHSVTGCSLEVLIRFQDDQEEAQD